MFTGLVEGTARIRSLERLAGEQGEAARLVLAELPWSDLPAPGDSVAVDGVCLTVEVVEEDALVFHLMPETVRRTTFAHAVPGMRVNVERALRVGDPLGGHIVTGHVDAVARVAEVEEAADGSRLVRFVLSAEYAPYLAPKGSVAVDGVSLTVVGVEAPVGHEVSFSVGLIPHTLAVTTLGTKGPGSRVNVEVDILARYVVEAVRRFTTSAGT
ncbi:MAG: Riboflavin synthase eubacterial/eukaryotic [Brockia lithotrophica]|uniref:Riboflavin synthase n=1 Tax=Brockia lithotrophica TaxID=933949 RepID=A0A2T5GAB6_9BACL|nr:riboflavin synthase [Brockia lithotrophica]PTQ53125.1 MAG: Riboflavin synthase eubacterial/eukaryotic [Brockia lithotrophica]